MMNQAASRRAQELVAAGVPFVTATVVRAQRPTSAHAGDVALVLGDGTIEGFVGGSCAEHSVRVHALAALASGETTLLRILPFDGEPSGAADEGGGGLAGGGRRDRAEPMPLGRGDRGVPRAGAAEPACARRGRHADRSRRAPARRGDRVRGARRRGWDAGARLRRSRPGGRDARARGARAAAGRPRGGRALRGPRGEPRAREAACSRSCARTASRRRCSRGSTCPPASRSARAPPARSRSRSSRGWWRLAAARPRERAQPAAAVAPPAAVAVDPICGMTVAAVAGTVSLEHEGTTVYFCCEGCRSQFEARRQHAGAGA